MTTRRREKLTAYIAGVFDSEGCVGVYKFESNTNFKAHVSIQMDNPVPIGLIHREFPESVFSTGLSKSGNNYWRVTFNGLKSYDFLKTMKPYCFAKHDQVSLALSFIVSQRKLGAKTIAKEDHLKYAEKVSSKLMLCKRENNAVNSVNALLDHEMREYRAKREDVAHDHAFLLEGVETRLSHHKTIRPSAPQNKI